MAIPHPPVLEGVHAGSWRPATSSVEPSARRSDWAHTVRHSHSEPFIARAQSASAGRRAQRLISAQFGQHSNLDAATQRRTSCDASPRRVRSRSASPEPLRRPPGVVGLSESDVSADAKAMADRARVVANGVRQAAAESVGREAASSPPPESVMLAAAARRAALTDASRENGSSPLLPESDRHEECDLPVFTDARPAARQVSHATPGPVGGGVDGGESAEEACEKWLRLSLPAASSAPPHLQAGRPTRCR